MRLFIRMIKFLKLLFPALALVAPVCAMGQFSMQTFSYYTGYQNDYYNGLMTNLSKDGSTVLLPEGFWTPATGNVALVLNYTGGVLHPIHGDGFFLSYLSRNGQVLCGDNTFNQGSAYYDVAILADKYGDYTILPPPVPDVPLLNYQSAGLSADGLTTFVYTVVHGANYYDQSEFNVYALSYTQSGGYTTIRNVLAQTYINNIVSSEDGQVIAEGVGDGPTTIYLKDRSGNWSQILSSSQYISVTAMSPDGSVVWGTYNGNGYRWTQATGLQLLPNFIPNSVTDDSFAATGYWIPYTGGELHEELWTASGGTVDLKTYLNSNGLSGFFDLDQGAFISGDGTHLAFSDEFQNDGFYVTMPGFKMTANDDSYTVQPSVQSSISAGQGVLANDVNVFNGTAALVSGPSNAASFTLNANGSFQYRPKPLFSGQDTFTYQIDRDLTPSNVATVTITVLSSVNVNVQERLGLGPVPDGTQVKIYNNDGTPLSPPQSATTVSGVAAFPPLPAPTGSNTTYEIAVSVPAGGIGKPVVVHNANGGSLTVYLTPVRPFVKQTLTTGAPVAFASTLVCGFKSSTGTNGLGGVVWLPDGSFSATFTMSPGIPAVVPATLGASPSSNLKAEGTYAQLCAYLTRTSLTAKTSAGKAYIPKTGTWAVSPGGLSEAVNGQVISGPWWLPNGTYTASLSGATENGSSSIIVGPPTSQGWQTVVVAP